MEETRDTATIDIFKLAESELYDEDEEIEEEPRPRKGNRGKLLVAIACVSLLLGICGLGFGINRSIAVKKANTELTAAKQEALDKQTTIENLNATIAAKDAEIEQLKKPAAQADTKTAEQKTEEKATGDTKWGVDGSIYKVVSDTGMNIRASADASSEVVASLANGDEFEQEGDIIKNDDGSLWVKFKWDNGYGCVQAADGTILAKLK